MKILAADDEMLQLNRLERTIAEAIPNAETISFSQPSKIVEWIEQGGEADIAFLDIEMGSMNGIQIAKKLIAAKPRTNIIFVTGYIEYAFDAFKVHASDYITKPVSVEKIRQAMRNLRYGMSKPFVRTFGDFDLFIDGSPVLLRKKSKELLAYLVYKRGGVANKKEIAAVLFEDDYSATTQDYLKKIYRDLEDTLKKQGAGNLLVKGFNQYAVDVTKFDCDLYDYDAGKPEALKAYKGDFMAQYDWAEM